MQDNSEIQSQITKLGNQMVDSFHLLGLFVIGAAIIWASWAEVFNIIAEHDHPTIKDILLLFIYLELGAMVGIYFKTKRLPVIFLIYIAITALTRLLTIDAKQMSDIHMITVTGSTLVLCLGVVLLQFGSSKLRGSSECEMDTKG
jgi:protein PsiE